MRWTPVVMAYPTASTAGAPPPLVINSLTPNPCPAGSVVTIAGTGFGSTQGSSTVKIGAILAVITSWSATSIKATVPSTLTAGAFQVLVTVAGVSTSAALSVTASTGGSGSGGTGSTGSGGGLSNYYDGRFGVYGTGGHRVSAGGDIQAALNAEPTGGLIWVDDGTYRPGSTLQPKAGQRIVGQSQNAHIKGSSLVDPTWWQSDGAGHWYYQDPWPKRGYIGDVFQTLDPSFNTRIPDQLYRDNIPLDHMSSLSAVGPNGCFLDSNGRYYIGADPTGHTFERATLPIVMTYGDGTVESVLLYNLSIDHSQTAVQEGGVRMGKGWEVLDCRAVGHHGRAFDVTMNCTIHGSITPWTGTAYTGNGATSSSQVGRAGSMVIDYVGATGIGGEYPFTATNMTDNNGFNMTSTDRNATQNIVITNVEIAHDNYARNMFTDEAGGIKFTLHRDIQINGCWIHGGQGIAIWFDDENYRFHVYDNLIEDNQGGIMLEVNDCAAGEGSEVFHNTLRRNGASQWSDAGAGYNSPSAIHCNILNSSSTNLPIHDNYVEMASLGYGIVTRYDARNPSQFNLGGATFTGNVVRTSSLSCAMGGDTTGSPPPAWDYGKVLTSGSASPSSAVYNYGGETNFSGWQGAGQDAHGSIQ